MASPAFRSQTWGVNFGLAIIDVSAAEPAGAANGDGLFVTVLSEIGGGPGVISMPAPWVFVADVTSGPYRFAFWYARRGASNPGYTASFSVPVNGSAQLTALAFSGCTAVGTIVSAALMGVPGFGDTIIPPQVVSPSKEAISCVVATSWTGWTLDPLVPSGYTFRQGPSTVGAPLDSVIASKALANPGTETPGAFGPADANDANVACTIVFCSRMPEQTAVWHAL